MNVDIFFYKVGQTLRGLTSDKSYMRTKKDRREYVDWTAQKPSSRRDEDVGGSWAACDFLEEKMTHEHDHCCFVLNI